MTSTAAVAQRSRWRDRLGAERGEQRADDAAVLERAEDGDVELGDPPEQREHPLARRARRASASTLAKRSVAAPSSAIGDRPSCCRRGRSQRSADAVAPRARGVAVDRLVGDVQPPRRGQPGQPFPGASASSVVVGAEEGGCCVLMPDRPGGTGAGRSGPGPGKTSDSVSAVQRTRYGGVVACISSTSCPCLRGSSSGPAFDDQPVIHMVPARWGTPSLGWGEGGGRRVRTPAAQGLRSSPAGPLGPILSTGRLRATGQHVGDSEVLHGHEDRSDRRGDGMAGLDRGRAGRLADLWSEEADSDPGIGGRQWPTARPGLQRRWAGAGVARAAAEVVPDERQGSAVDVLTGQPALLAPFRVAQEALPGEVDRALARAERRRDGDGTQPRRRPRAAHASKRKLGLRAPSSRQARAARGNRSRGSTRDGWPRLGRWPTRRGPPRGSTRCAAGSMSCG